MRSHASTSDLFKGRHFEQEIIILCVRWYLRYKLSYRDLVEMMAERGLPIAHTNNPALGSAVRTGVRQTLEPLRDVGWHLLAGRRDLRQDPRSVGLSLPGCRLGRQYRRLPAQPAAQRRFGQGILS